MRREARDLRYANTNHGHAGCETRERISDYLRDEAAKIETTSARTAETMARTTHGWAADADGSAQLAAKCGGHRKNHIVTPSDDDDDGRGRSERTGDPEGTVVGMEM